jgi:hypothetical protein
MTFIHPLLLGGLALLGLPVVIHLIMRQQPRHLLFPALRFLKLQQRTNQRKLRLRHLLLLLLRMLLIALMCLALARPRLFNERLNSFLGGDQPVALALVLDTSPSMGYTLGGETRLNTAKARALELLDEVSEASRFAVIDTADPVPEWLASRAAARERITALTIRPANQPVTAGIDAALRLFEPAAGEPVEEEPLPRFIHVFSDRTPACWDTARATELKGRRQRLQPVPKCVFVDVGAAEPADLAVADLEMRPQVVSANRPAVFRVTVRAEGQPFNNALVCQFDDEGRVETKPIDLKAGGAAVVEFERGGLAPGWHRAEVKTATDDGLPGNNFRFVTFEVRPPRKVLVLCDDRRDAFAWDRAIHNQGLYQCDVKEVGDPAAAADLAAYRAVILLAVSAPDRAVWDGLRQYVFGGGALAVVPPTEGLRTETYRAADLLPAEFGAWEWAREGVGLIEYQYQHPLLAPFRTFATMQNIDFIQRPPQVFQYWKVKPHEGAAVLLRYGDADKSPALVERVFDRAGGRGRVLLFTTALDGRQAASGRVAANDFMTSSFYLVLVNEACRSLAGEALDAEFNHLSGQAVNVALPPAPRFPTYTLDGPGLSGSDSTVTRPAEAGELRLTQPKEPGHYRLTGGGQVTTAFSLNLPPAESLLLPRLAKETVEELFGPESLVELGSTQSLRDGMEGQFKQPVELFPWLMLLLLLALAVENYVANRFYRAPPQEGEPAAAAGPAAS